MPTTSSTVKANQLFMAGHKSSLEEGLAAITAILLLIASADDLVFPPPRHMRALKEKLAAMGKTITYSEAITTDLGHLDGIAYIAKAGDAIASFLGEPLAA
jgi:homoserine O-acetyltransferase